jgi:hypothetical protein
MNHVTTSLNELKAWTADDVGARVRTSCIGLLLLVGCDLAICMVDERRAQMGVILCEMVVYGARFSTGIYTR